MAIYKYSGRNSQGKPISGTIEAATEEAAAGQLMNDGIIPISIRTGGQFKGSANLVSASDPA